MDYHIKTSTKRIASFEEETDRDMCLDAFIEYGGEEGGVEAEDD